MRKLLQDLDDLAITDRLEARYFEQWRNSDPEGWTLIAAKLDVLAGLRLELRSLANQGVDDDG